MANAKTARGRADFHPNMHDDALISGIREEYIEARPDLWKWK